MLDMKKSNIASFVILEKFLVDFMKPWNSEEALGSLSISVCFVVVQVMYLQGSSYQNSSEEIKSTEVKFLSKKRLALSQRVLSKIPTYFLSGSRPTCPYIILKLRVFN